MAPIVAALKDLGVQVAEHGADGMLPFTLTGTGRLAGGSIVVDGASSSQFISALLLIGARTADGLEITAAPGPIASPDHIEMTVQTLGELGVTVTRPDARSWKVEPGTITAFDKVMEPDLSNAGPFLAAALVTAGTVRIPHWPAATTQVGDRWREILGAMGAEVRHLADGTLEVTGPAEINGIDFADASELAPTLAALCALATGPSRLTGIAHLRGHETDRLAALATEINNLGGKVTELEDGLLIEPAHLHGGDFGTYADHRMATAGAIIGLAVAGRARDRHRHHRQDHARLPRTLDDAGHQRKGRTLSTWHAIPRIGKTSPSAPARTKRAPARAPRTAPPTRRR